MKLATLLRFIQRAFEFTCLLALACAVYLVATGNPSWLTISAVAVVIGAGFGFWLLSLVFAGIRQRIVFKRSGPQPKALDIDDLKRDVDAQHANIDLAQAELFSNLIIRPAEYFLRIAESASPMEGHTTVSSKYTVALPAELRTRPIVLPLVLKDRGVLTDGLKIMNAEGKRISSMAQRSQIGFLAAVCRELVLASGDSDLLGFYVKEVEPEVLNILASQNPTDGIRYLEVLDAIYALRKVAAVPAWIDVLPMYLREWRVRSPILIEVPAIEFSAQELQGSPTTNVRFTVDQDIALADKSWDSFRRSDFLNNVWRVFRNVKLFVLVLLGVKSNDILIPLDNAERCKSYHLQCDGPPDAYLGDQHLEPPEDGSTWQTKPRRGQSYSHLYIQDGKEYNGRHFQSSFYEIPPGSTGIAAAVALAALFGLVILGLHQLKWSPDPSFGSTTLLLGLPGAIAAFLGFGKTAGFLRGSFRARISTILSLISAMVGLGSAAIIARSAPHSDELIVLDIQALPPILIFWFVLVGIQALNLLVISSLWLYRAYVYWAAKTSYH